MSSTRHHDRELENEQGGAEVEAESQAQGEGRGEVEEDVDEEGEAAVDLHVGEMPMTMAASVVLDHLPRDAHMALNEAGRLGVEKITIHLKSLPNTPQLKQPRFKCDSSQNFEYIVRFLRRRLKVKDHESVCCYVNSVFAPALDEGLGNLWRCFKVGDELIVHYSLTQAFG